MSAIQQETVMRDVLGLLTQLSRDWEYSGEITPDTWLFADLGFESIDAVILTSFVQEHYGRTFPFPQLLAEVGHREVKDLRIGELVGFIQIHLNDGVAAKGKP